MKERLQRRHETGRLIGLSAQDSWGDPMRSDLRSLALYDESDSVGPSFALALARLLRSKHVITDRRLRRRKDELGQ